MVVSNFSLVWSSLLEGVEGSYPNNVHEELPLFIN